MSTKERPPAERAQVLQSPFVDEEVLTRSPAKEWEPRTSALVSVQPPTQPPDTTDLELEADTSFMATEANGAGWTEEEETEDLSEQYEPDREDDEGASIEVETGPHRAELAQLETALAHLEGQLQEVARELDQLGPDTGAAPPHLEAQLGTLRARLGDLLTPEPSPNADVSVAVPPFCALTRLAMPAPLLSARGSADAVTWNQRHHPRISGIDPNHVRTDIARYVNLAIVTAGIQRFNQQNPKAPIVLGAAPIDAVFVEAVHQFQAKCFFEPSQIDGLAGESTLDSLGLVKRRGLRSVARRNSAAMARLRRADVPRLTGNEFTANAWFDFMVNPTFLGWRFTAGAHLLLVRKLRTAERDLLSQDRFRCMTPVQLGTALSFDDTSEVHRGARPDASTASMHTYGLALDIKYAGNPFVQGARFTEALTHAALLVGGLAITQRTSEAFFASLAGTGDTATVYRTLALHDGHFRRYLALRNQRDELESILRRWEASRLSLTPPGIFARSTESVDQAATRWQRIVRRDYDRLSSGAVPFLTRDPLKGFLNLPQELVVALRDKAGLAWGAVDFGARDSGDVMHFDARVCGIGDRLAEIGGNFRVSQDHPCLPCPPPPAASEAEREALDEAQDDLAPGNRTEADGALFEMFAPDVSQTDLKTRIDEYFDRANAEYDLGHTTVRARPQFRYARGGDSEEAKTRVRRVLGAAFERRHPGAIHAAAYGRAKPSDVAAVTQGLIAAGELEAVRTARPHLLNAQLVRALQRKFKVGIDCAGYVQLAFMFAFTGSDNDPARTRKSLGLHEKRGWEALRSLPTSHFTRVRVVEGQTGDLLVLKPRADSNDRAWHTVIVVERTVATTRHTFLVDASWGVDLYGDDAGGVARRKFVHDTSSGTWWDIHPVSGSKVHENAIGPYDGHPIHGMFRPKHKK